VSYFRYVGGGLWVSDPVTLVFVVLNLGVTVWLVFHKSSLFNWVFWLFYFILLVGCLLRCFSILYVSTERLVLDLGEFVRLSSMIASVLFFLTLSVSAVGCRLGFEYVKLRKRQKGERKMGHPLT